VSLSLQWSWDPEPFVTATERLIDLVYASCGDSDGNIITAPSEQLEEFCRDAITAAEKARDLVPEPFVTPTAPVEDEERDARRRGKVYGALCDQKVVRGSVLGGRRALDAPEMEQIAAIAVAALRGSADVVAERDLARRRAEREASDAAALRRVAEERDQLRRELDALRGAS
jgi:hypothetical protein